MTKGKETHPSVNMGSMGLACKRCCCAGESCFRVIWKATRASTPHHPCSDALGYLLCCCVLDCRGDG